MSPINYVKMKVPNGSPPPPSLPSPGAVTAAPGSAGERSNSALLLEARIQLDQLQIANRATVLARVAQVVRQMDGQTDQLILQLRGKSLPVQATIGDTQITAGDWIKLMRVGNELQLLGKLGATPDALITQALAQRLPWQQRLDTGLVQLLNALTQGVRPDVPGPGGLQPTPLPPAAREAIQQLLSQLPTQSRLSAAPASSVSRPEAGASQVRQWLSESGLFAESRLSRGPEPNMADLKLALARVVAALSPDSRPAENPLNRLTPLVSPELVQAPLQFPNLPTNPLPASRSEPVTVGQMLRLLAGMLNRVSVNQLHSQVLSARPTADGAPPAATLLLELPWLTSTGEPRVAQLRIEQEPGGRDKGTAASGKKVVEWRLALAMDLDTLGPLHFDVALRQHQVSALVWAERTSTLNQLKAQIGELQRSFSDLGLDVVDLDCRKGQPSGARTQLEHRLVDIKA
ncbi:flagellar hook-length control protein FliK [Marinobacter zhejiangensis]|uniref:Hook-length control protein FliK n=1 Tax=Marinobacter zhejiangensis TaxID=488535 RepID=A0A1I4NQC1_9GAMM|nr:flagellar hook-length control protein FliK [Marinobacter zhejiangensis]SFM17732.1 hook-length control protein FliK [Marinobacter zhejiangensis]